VRFLLRLFVFVKAKVAVIYKIRRLGLASPRDSTAPLTFYAWLEKKSHQSCTASRYTSLKYLCMITARN